MEIVELRREVKTYYGIEYALVLIGPKGKYADSFSPQDGDIYEDLWWCVEFTDKSKNVTQRAKSGLLWWDTKSWTDKRLVDKKNQCELKAVLEIHWLMGEYPGIRGKYVATELFRYIFVMWMTTPQRMVYRFKKLIGKQV